METPEFLSLLAGLSARRVEAVTEPSGSYGFALEELLRRAQFPVFRVSPKRSHDAAEVYDGVPSRHDAKAAAIIAKLHLDGLSRPAPQRSVERRQLSALVGVLDQYQQHQQRLLNRLEAQLAVFWPELGQHLSLDSASLLTLLSTYGCASQVASRPEQARGVLRRASRGRLEEETIDAVLRSARETLGMQPVACEVEALQELAREALRTRKQLSSWEKRVCAQSRQHEPVRRMSEVAGQVTAAVLFSELGSPADYPSTRAYLKADGLNLKVHQSGKKVGRLAITKRGPGRCRRYLMMMALRFIQHDAVVAAWYAKKVARDGGVKMKAVVAVMRKLLSALWHVGRGARFDSSELFDVRRLELASSH
jgi:transposase